MTREEYLKFLTDKGYTDIKLIGGNQWAGIFPTSWCFSPYVIVRAYIGDTEICTGTWRYPAYKDALKALRAWDGTGEPKGGA